MQAQLEELKNHVLLRKDTFTVFKDEASSYDEKQKPDSGTQATIIPFDASAQTDNPRDSKVDHRRVSLREPTRGNVVLEQQSKDQTEEASNTEKTKLKRLKYDYPQYNKVPTCETTCKREGLPCTEECQNENKKKGQNQPTNRNYNRMNDDDIRYQIPEPASAYTPDVSDTRHVNDQNNLQLKDKQGEADKIENTTAKHPEYNHPKYSKIPTCESTCKREGLPCTKECQNENEKKVQGQPNSGIKRRNDDDNRYQIPGPVSAYTPDVSGTRRVNDQNNIQPMELSTNRAWRTGYGSSTQQDFFGAGSSKEPRHTGNVKEESPLMNFTQNFDNRGSSNVQNYQEPSRNAQYAKENAFSSQHGKNNDTWLKPAGTNTNNKNPWHIETSNGIQHQQEGENCNCAGCQRLKEIIAKARNVDLKPVSGKNTSTKSASKATKKIPVKCMCPHKSEYTTNILHTSTGPIIMPNLHHITGNDDSPYASSIEKRNLFLFQDTMQTLVSNTAEDINSHERQFADNKLNNFDEKGPDSLLHEIKGGLNAQKKTDDFENNMQQLQPLPVATSSPFAHVSDRTTQKTDKATDNKLDVSESCTQTCTGPKTTYRDVEVFRSCSGTLRFETINNPCQSRKSISSSPGFLNVHGTRQDTSCCKFKTEQNTYTIEASADKTPKPAEQKYSRATSPENTDQEISSLTDLPSEKTSTTPRETIGCGTCARISPGEDKSTTVKSETVTSPTTSSKPASYPLSDGEMPQYFAGSPKARNESFYMDPEPLEEKRKEVGKSTLKVEQALQSISEELARCRELLEKPKETLPQKERERTIRLKDLVENEKLNDNERGYVEGRKNYHEAFGPNPGRSSFALHHAQAKPHIGNVPNTPHVIFTLHIGTVVLSDEAVINSRNLNLVLTWKFYDQNEAMSHMRPGRVVHFDFSTEYDVNLTDHFLNYMRTEELEINICELTKLNSPFASCSMPLREALLHTNRRADMSLALVAGPQMRRSSAKDKLDTRDEMGVLDLWCMLRSEPRNFPRISLAIAQSRPSRIDSYGMRQQKYADTALNPLTINENQDGKRGSSDLDQVFQQPIRLQDRDSKQPSRRSTARLAINEVRSKSTGQLVLTPELMEKFPGAHNIRKVSLVSNQGINSSLIMAPPDQSEKRNWKNPQEIEQSLKRASNIDLIRNNQRISTDSGKYTMTDFPVKGTGRFDGTKKAVDAYNSVRNKRERDRLSDRFHDAMIGNKNKDSLTIDITILWLALNEECPAMSERSVQKLYVAYSFLGRGGAELETPQSLPKPKQYQDKCYFNFKKSFHLTNADLVAVGRLARYRTPHNGTPNPKESVVFTVVSEPAEDPLGLNNCEDIGYAYLYFGDLVAFSADNDSYTEVIPVHDAQTRNCICGVLSVRVDGLNVVRKCLTISLTDPKFRKNS
ncbi:first c2 domain of RPGR-interacting protein 1 domain-containing protein [Phthorimaea operculella]|nr:first c2 domain of RPGR-interacting protein 1 domain-containing protein [Phthorimaea operculella]